MHPPQMKVSCVLYIHGMSLQQPLGRRLGRSQSPSGCFVCCPVYLDGVPTKLIKIQTAQQTVFMAFRNVMPCHFIFMLEEASALKMEAADFSGMLLHFLKTSWCHIPKHIICDIHYHENLKFYFCYWSAVGEKMSVVFCLIIHVCNRSIMFIQI